MPVIIYHTLVSDVVTQDLETNYLSANLMFLAAIVPEMSSFTELRAVVPGTISKSSYQI